MELILTGISLLLVFLMWKNILKRSLLDTHRDQLFDLRDDLRETFIKNKWEMDSQIYMRMRDLLNGYLRYTENFSYAEFNYIETSIKQNKELQQAMKERFEKKFSCSSATQAEYIAKIRQTARQVMMSYMITSSGYLATVIVIAFPFVAAYMLVSFFIKALMASGLSVFTKVKEIREICSSFALLVIALIATKVLTEDLVEEYSYRQAVV